MTAEGKRGRLARRLRSLRTRTWSHRRITQVALADALGVSPALISSWESASAKTIIPPRFRLDAYARFFASERSVENMPYRLLALTDLTDEERARWDDLFRELIGLSGLTTDDEPSVGRSRYDGTPWQFPQGEDITIVCSELPKERRVQALYTNPDMPDYVELYKFADLDALLELHGHIRAANPTSHVHIRIAADMHPDEYSTHLVLLGGIDWNKTTASILPDAEMPVRQMNRPDDSSPGGFEVIEGDLRVVLEPVLDTSGEREVLKEDVAHFYRSTNPFNMERTVTICNGSYQRGTLGIVRALTDERFRNRNEQYIRARFPGVHTFSIISRVRVVNGAVITPDWTKDENRLHEWPAPQT